MGFLSGITDSLFGGADDTGIKAQQQSNARSQAYIEQQAALARGDANQLYGQGDYARNLGINLAMALMGKSLPQQMALYQDGNTAAQQQYIQGQTAYKDAILGTGRNQPTQSPYRATLPDASSYQTQLPDFGQSWNVGGPQQGAQASAQPVAQQGAAAPNALGDAFISQFLGGRFR